MSGDAAADRDTLTEQLVGAFADSFGTATRHMYAQRAADSVLSSSWLAEHDKAKDEQSAKDIADLAAVIQRKHDALVQLSAEHVKLIAAALTLREERDQLRAERGGTP